MPWASTRSPAWPSTRVRWKPDPAIPTGMRMRLVLIRHPVRDRVVAASRLDLRRRAAGQLDRPKGGVFLLVGRGIAQQVLRAQLVLDLVEGLLQLLPVVAHVDHAPPGILRQL